MPANERATVATHATHAGDTFSISIYSIFLSSCVRSKKRSVASVAASQEVHAFIRVVALPRLAGSPSRRGMSESAVGRWT